MNQRLWGGPVGCETAAGAMLSMIALDTEQGVKSGRSFRACRGWSVGGRGKGEGGEGVEEGGGGGGRGDVCACVTPAVCPLRD